MHETYSRLGMRILIRVSRTSGSQPLRGGSSTALWKRTPFWYIPGRMRSTVPAVKSVLPRSLRSELITASSMAAWDSSIPTTLLALRARYRASEPTPQ